MNAVAGGWRINGIVDASSGFPFSVYSGFHTATFYDSGTRVATTSANGVTNRADYAGSENIGEVRRTERGVDFFSAEERAMFQTPEPGAPARSATCSRVPATSRSIWGSSRTSRSAASGSS